MGIGQKVKKDKAPDTPARPESVAQRMERETLEREGYKPIASGPIHTWEAGTVAKGTLLDIRKGQYGPLFDIELEGGEVQTWACPAILASRVRRIPTGSAIYVRCTGTTATASGEAWDFAVMAKPKDRDGDIPF